MPTVGDNIKALRNLWGITQTQLGDAISLANNTISKYENSSFPPPTEILQLIASYFVITVDQLINDDFSNPPLSLAPISSSMIIANLDAMLPLIKSESAMKNPLFQDGYRYASTFWNCMKTMNNPVLSTLSTAFTQFSTSLKQHSTIESAANILWIIFVRYLIIPDLYHEKLGEAIFTGKGTKTDFGKNYLLNKNKCINNHATELRKQFIERNEDTIFEMIKLLKKSPKYSELGDYYIALKYLICLIDNDESPQVNNTIGQEMLVTLYKLGNQYATAYLETRFPLYELHEM